MKKFNPKGWIAYLVALYGRVPQRFKNRYVFSILALFFWLLIFDRNDLIGQAKLQWQLRELEQKKGFYREKIKEVKQDREDLFGSRASVEKFAREKYFMKRDDEDIFIIVSK